MRSLRARLLAALLAVTTLGLLLLATITYLEQRSFQYERLDEQARGAIGAVSQALGAGPPGGPDRDRGGGGPGRGGPRFGLPCGTYGERRDASGKVLSGDVICFSGDDVQADPDLPAELAPGELVTVDGENGDDARYRVFAAPSPGSGLIVAAIPMTETDRTLRRLLVVEALVIAAVLLLLAALAWVLVRVGLLPLDRMTATAGRIAGGDLSHRVEDEDARTEVGRLGLALNQMLDRLEHAFTEREQSEERLRRFIADASHELRTPLASIRGYAELFRMGAASDEAAVARSMQRIEDEAARMGVLVEDLLTLARLDEVADAPHVDVDLAALVRDAADDARATAPDRAIAVDAEGPSIVRGDPGQLRQVLANLTRNALVHTPAGTPVELSVSGGRVTVRDHGPGLPADDPAALFERFWRAEGGRERGKSGAGLGLAIVAAIVDAHGGRVSGRNADGGGAEFVLELPSVLSHGSEERPPEWMA
jgi:two-component system OmpR family sensor kinase